MRYDTLRHVILLYVTLYVTLHYATVRYIMPRNAKLRYATLGEVVKSDKIRLSCVIYPTLSNVPLYRVATYNWESSKQEVTHTGRIHPEAGERWRPGFESVFARYTRALIIQASHGLKDAAALHSASRVPLEATSQSNSRYLNSLEWEI